MESGGDDPPLLTMVAAQEAGCSSLQSFLELDGMEYRAWVDYAMNGPSEIRTQLLIAQLVQMVSSALGGKSIAIGKLLPYHDDITGAHTKRGAKERRQRHIATHQGMVDELIAKKVKKHG